MDVFIVTLIATVIGTVMSTYIVRLVDKKNNR